MQHEHHRVPVTALAFWNQDVLLAGEGSSIKAYDTEERNLLSLADVFSDQAIHGIIAEHDCILVWGGRLVCQLGAKQALDGSLVLDVGPVVEAEDWILDASFAPSSSEEDLRVALVTAHNALIIAELSKPLRVNLESQVPGSNCILYAAHVAWLSASTCLIASGTAFGDIIVWSCSVERKECKQSSTHQTHYTFSAHEGSVFGVSISSPSVADSLGGRKCILASCSDDRTIRLWDISDLTATSRTLAKEQRETGFGTKPADDSSAPTCLGNTMGHISRIWRVRFLQNQQKELHTAAPKPVYVVSFGEDASCISWLLEPSNDGGSTYSMKQSQAQKAHTGKNIWSVAVDQFLRIATGGADGSIALRSFYDMKGHGLPEEIGRGLLGDDKQADNFRTYAFVSQSTLITTTNSGRLILLSFDANSRVSSKQVSPTIDSLHGYSTMASVPGVAFSAGTRGRVYAYMHELGDVIDVIETGSKVAGMFCQSPQLSSEKASQPLELLITNVASLSALFCKITIASTAREAGSLLKVATSTLTLPPNFVVTSFAHTTHSGRSLAVLGSRSGSIAVYNVSDIRDEASTTPTLLSSSVHGKEAVTCICFTKSVTDSQSVFFLSTGRDGTYAGHKLELSSEGFQIQTVHQLNLPFGPNVEGIGYSIGGHLWTWGFRSKQFVVWDIDTQQEVMGVDCGGANRNWAFQPGENGGTFVWTKAGKVYCETQNRLPFNSINAGGHGREIKSLAISPIESQLIATGAEDTDIKLSKYNDGAIQCVYTLHKHNTGIQHLQWSTDGCFLFSSGGFEEFYVWRISYNVPGLHVGVLCESTHPNSGKSDLRIMHFGAQRCDDGEEQVFHITMVYSDSGVRAWRYASRTWSLLATGNYLTSCLTQCLPVVDRETSLTTGSTDGYLATWKTAEERGCMEWISRHQVHQSSILSLASHDLVDTSRLIITGGDDNALGITRMSGSSESPRTLLAPRAHAAAITALVIVQSEANHLIVVSASIDQRIKLWQVDINFDMPGVDGIDIKLLKTCFTPVADVSGVESIELPGNQIGVLVCGVGMDLWKIE